MFSIKYSVCSKQNVIYFWTSFFLSNIAQVKVLRFQFLLYYRQVSWSDSINICAYEGQIPWFILLVMKFPQGHWMGGLGWDAWFSFLNSRIFSWVYSLDLTIRTCRYINSEEISCQLLIYQPQDFFQTKGIQCVTVNLTLISQRNGPDSPYLSFPSLSCPDSPSFNSIILGTTFSIQAQSQHSFILRNLYKQLVYIVFNLLDIFVR